MWLQEWEESERTCLTFRLVWLHKYFSWWWGANRGSQIHLISQVWSFQRPSAEKNRSWLGFESLGAFLPTGQRWTPSRARPALFTDEFGENPEFTHLRKKKKMSWWKKTQSHTRQQKKTKKKSFASWIFHLSCTGRGGGGVTVAH